MVKFSCLIVLVALNLSTAKALSCYGCIASTDSDCYRGVVSSFFNQQCQSTMVSNLSVLKGLALNDSVPIETVCVSLVLTDFQPKVVERGCGYIYEGVDIYQICAIQAPSHLK
ncbi:hypothetical protein RN001_014892 [Aquatica leii]|uniref:Uncharacterized protein n=1 Tax=Aquatica leii TaxID=1421715 RepID=A0AAN7SKU4_9COLE|nr:hypothetical protein RN001_014892 [Aquatica leii]